MADPSQAAPGAPWFDPETQAQLRWRDDDVVLSVPPKSGTNWLMNIVQQLRTGGDDQFTDIHVDIPWIELVEYPGQPREERLARWEALPRDRRRVFKTHSGPPVLPFVEQVEYLVVIRNPEEALVSFRPFLEQHSQAFFDMWGVPKQAMSRPDFASYHAEIVEGMGLDLLQFGLFAGWWPLRNRPNVLMLHYADLVREPEANIRRIAERLGFAPTAEQWPTILERCSFAWMKANEAKFELREVARVPILDPGGMIRKGKLGGAKDEGMTEAISRRIRERAASVVEPGALDWYYHGGPLPRG
jgi:hypothetical protein